MIIRGYALPFLNEKLSSGYSIELTYCKFITSTHKNGFVKKKGKVALSYPNIPSKYTPYIVVTGLIFVPSR